MRNYLTVACLILLFQIAVMANGMSASCVGFYESNPANDQVSKYQNIISELVQKKPSEVNAGFRSEVWSCTTNACAPFSGQLHFALKKLQMPVERISVDSSFKLNVPNLPSGGFHYFVIDASIPGREIIIDPTYKQFFNGPIPEADIFVGTREQLEDLFVKYHSYIKLQDGSSATRLDPRGVVEAYYGYGRAEKTKYNTPSRTN